MRWLLQGVMMKRFASLLMTVCLIAVAALSLVACSAEADKSSVTVYGFNYSTSADDAAGEGYKGFATVKKYVLTEEQSKIVSNGNFSGNMIDLVIPAEYVAENGDKYKVNAVADAAFANQLLVRSVTFGANVETIGAGCLAGCTNLQSVTVPFTGAKVGAVNEKKTVGYLFGTSESTGCNAATVHYNGGDSSAEATYYIPAALKTVTVTGDAISEYAFNGLPVENVVLSGAVTAVPEGAFALMTALTSVKLPVTVKTIAKGAFKNSTALLGVNFEELTALESLGAEVFYGCSNYGYKKTMVFPASLKNVGASCFYNCAELAGVDFTATAVTDIPDYAFYGCAKLKTTEFKSGTTFGKYAFEGCDSLED